MDEDQLVPRMSDSRGHAANIMAPGGWIAKTDLDGRHWELICIGFRNVYDAAFNREGDLSPTMPIWNLIWVPPGIAQPGSVT